MPRKLTEYNLLFSCPGDAYKECYPAVSAAVDDFNRYAKSNLSISANLTHWTKDSYPQSGGKPQALLNTQIVDTADAAIAVFWTRFGTPTDEYGSGTEEEIDRLINEKKQVFLYFLDKAIPPSLTESETYQEQRSQIALFRQKYERKGIYCVVKDENNLKKQFAQHLFLYFGEKTSEDTEISDIEKRINQAERNIASVNKRVDDLPPIPKITVSQGPPTKALGINEFWGQYK